MLNHWKDEFSSLYNIEFDVSEYRESEEFGQTEYEHKQQLETVHQDTCNVYLNRDNNFQ